MDTKVRKAVIPCAGFGTRFLPVTKVVPKELLPVGNKPAIHYVVQEAVASGIEEIILVCHPSKVSIVDYFRPDEDLKAFLKKRGKRKELEELEGIESLAKFTMVIQEQPLGLGHAVLCAREAVGDDPFVVMLPDRLVGHEIPAMRQLLEPCLERNSWGILLERVSRERVSAYGIIDGESMEEGIYKIRRIVEKPAPEGAPSDLAVLGRYFFTPEIFPWLVKSKPGALGEIQLTDGMDALTRETTGVGILCRGQIFDMGFPEGLLELCQHLDSLTRP